MIGDMNDQHALAPQTVITSALYDPTNVFKFLIEMYRNGTLEGNRSYNWGLKEGVTGIAPFYGLDYKVPQYIKDLVADVIKSVKNGSFTIPFITEQIH